VLFQDVRQFATYHAICRHVLNLRRLLRRGAAEPLLESHWGEPRVFGGRKALIVQLCAEVHGMGVRGYLPWVSHCAQEAPGEFIHLDRFGTGNLDGTVQWFGESEASHGGGDVIRRNRLEESW
jgi:hypothetical protein